MRSVGKVLGAWALDPDESTVGPYREGKVPRLRTPLCAQQPVVLQRVALLSRRRDICPWKKERHHGRIVNSARTEHRERVYVVVVRIVQLDPRCAHYEIEQRPVFAPHVLIVTRIVPINNRNSTLE